MPLVKAETQKAAGNVLEDVFRVGTSMTLVGLGGAAGGVIGSGLSLAAGYVSNRYIVKKAEHKPVVWVISIMNAVDVLLDGITPRGVVG